MFFFSSRRRHTRYWRDWSSDVCSSDLKHAGPGARVEVAVTVADGAVVVEVSDDGTGAGPVSRSGNGLRGIAEQIGRASCRERVQISVVAVPLKKKRRRRRYREGSRPDI